MPAIFKENGIFCIGVPKKRSHAHPLGMRLRNVQINCNKKTGQSKDATLDWLTSFSYLNFLFPNFLIPNYKPFKWIYFFISNRCLICDTWIIRSWFPDMWDAISFCLAELRLWPNSLCIETLSQEVVFNDEYNWTEGNLYVENDWYLCI